MRLLARHLNAFTQTHPGWSLVGVLLVALAFCLPAMHHLGDCDVSHPVGDPCTLCLLLNLTFLAVFAVLALDLARRLVALVVAETDAAPGGLTVLLRVARAPPPSC